MKKGVALLAIGNPTYMQWALQMACSIRHFSPGVPIQLIASIEFIAKMDIPFADLFDVLTIIHEDDYTDRGVFAPGKAKLALPYYFAYDRTLYLDVDGAVVRDITPLLDAEPPLIMQSGLYYIAGSVEKPAQMYWANSTAIINHYSLSGDTLLPSLNTSGYVYTNTPGINALFQKAYENLVNNPMPRSARRNTWGHGDGMQPDELYLNIAMGQLGIYPTNQQLGYFRTLMEPGRTLSISDIRAHHYYIGLFGGKNYNHSSLTAMYDALLKPIWLAKYPNQPFTKCHYLLPHKAVENKYTYAKN